MMKPYVAGFEERKGRRGKIGVLKVRGERWTSEGSRERRESS